jgi:tetratricopeptide (TPR) repeat protein
VWREVAGLYVQQGRSDEAEKLLKDALAWDEGYSPPVSMAVLGDLEMLESKIYIPQARFADAERTIRRQMALRETQYGRDSSPVADLLDRHAVVLEKLNRTDEAQRAKAEAKAIRQSLGQNIGDW